MITQEQVRKFADRIALLFERVGPSKDKAKKMLADNSAQGHALTPDQKSFFQAIAHGWKPTGKGRKKK